MFLVSKLKRHSALAAAALLLGVSFVPLLSQQKAGAYGLLTSREIRMSSSTASATDVTYLVRATTPSNGVIDSIAIQFCSNSPIIGDSCTAPGGFSTNEVGLALANQTGVTDWAIDASTTANTLVLNRTSTGSTFNAGTFTLELGSTGGSDGITNPNTANATFYGRIMTFTDKDDDSDGCSAADDWAGCFASGNHNQSVHAGGTAQSTAAEITVTSKVQERLTFCVYTDGNNDATLGDANYTSCSGVGGTAITLGDTNGVLSDSGAFVDKNTMYNIATNASNGATVRVRGATLTSGSFTIDGMGASTTNDSTPGSEEFGFCNYRDAGGGTTGLTPASPYADAACSGTTQTAGTGATGGDNNANFAFDTVTACNSTASDVNFESTSLACRYGDAIASKSAGNMSTGRVVFIGNIATTTEPGIYTSTLNFIATGNY